MPEFIITYHGGRKPDTPEEGAEGMQKWKAWAAGLGEALTNPGTPVGVTTVLNEQGVSDQRPLNPLMGFSIIEASDMDTAVELVKDCPHLYYFDGVLEVPEMMEMPS